MPPSKSEKEIREFLGRLPYIIQFIAKLTSTYDPIFKLLRKNEPHTWNKECQKAFELIKEYFLQWLILVALKQGKPLFLYLSIIENAIGSMLVEKDDDKNERAVYYLSKRFHDYETRYTLIEKSRFALVWIWIVARMDSLKYPFEKLTLSGRLSRWLILLVEFNLKYVARKTIKGSFMSDFCVENSVEGEDSREDFPD